MIKKAILILLSCVFLSGCVQKDVENDKISVVTTLFPQYDFARQIAGDMADVSLLLPPGVETHSFEPSPSDIIKIGECDLFIYTSKYMEPWVDKLIGQAKEGISVCQATSGIEHEKHGGDVDAHVWTNPENAILMAENILNALCEIDGENADYYKNSYNSYVEELLKLDGDLESVIEDAPIKKMVFGTKFSLHYFGGRYGISHLSAFDSCGHEGEPSGKIMGEIIDTVKKEGIPAIFYGELESHKVADTIANETGTKTLMFHSCHNVTRDELESGETYISLMNKNILALKEGLYND